MRRRAKVDNNHVEIADVFRKAGWSVVSLASVGNGCPDLLVSHPAVDDLKLIEVKAAKGKLTADQLKFHQAFPVAIVRSVDEALAIIQGEV